MPHLPRLHGTSIRMGYGPRLWLAVIDCTVRLPAPNPPVAPEMPMSVRFEGLSEAEQRRALTAFPGGGRFVLT